MNNIGWNYTRNILQKKQQETAQLPDNAAESDENENIISEEDDAAFIPLFHINDLQTRKFWESRLEHRNDISKEGANSCLLAYQIEAAVDVNIPDFALSAQDRLIVEEAVLQSLCLASPPNGYISRV